MTTTPGTAALAAGGDVAFQRTPRGLLRVLGVGFGLAVIVGNTIGAGILRAPGEVAAQAGSAPWFLALWLAGALYALLGANTLSELATMMPRSGGQYVFVRRALGEYPGFVVGWSDWISTAASAAAVALAMAEYAGDLFPALAVRVPLLAAATVAAFTAVQWRGIRSASRAQAVTSLLKALAFAVLIGACFLIVGRAAPPPAAAPGGLPTLLGMVVALQIIIYTYDGWTGVIYFSEEVRDPGRDIPRAMFGGVLSVAGIYLLLNLALLRVVPFPAMAGDTLVAGSAARIVFGEAGDTVIRALMIVALLSAINAMLLMASRVLFAVGADGFLPAGAVRTNPGGTPAITLAASAAIAVFFIATGTFQKVIAMAAFFFVANYALSFLSVFVLRRREPETPRPYRARGHPWTTGLMLAGSLAFLASAVAADRRNSLYAVLLLAASYPAYRALRGRKGLG